MAKLLKKVRKFKKAVNGALVQGATAVAVFAPQYDDKFKAAAGVIGSVLTLAVVVISENEEL